MSKSNPANSGMDERDRLPRQARRLVRAPVLLQLESVECGAACLGILLAHFGRWVSLEELREACSVGRDGSTIADIAVAAEKYGLKATGWRKEIRQLREMRLPRDPALGLQALRCSGRLQGPPVLPSTIPANGRRTVSEEEFDKSFTGVILACEPGADFRTGGKRPGMLGRVLPWLRNVKWALAFSSLCGGMLMVAGLAMPIILSLFVDRVIQGREHGLGESLSGCDACRRAAHVLAHLAAAKDLQPALDPPVGDQGERIRHPDSETACAVFCPPSLR